MEAALTSRTVASAGTPTFADEKRKLDASLHPRA
jgi:hypothetical protein